MDGAATSTSAPGRGSLTWVTTPRLLDRPWPCRARSPALGIAIGHRVARGDGVAQPLDDLSGRGVGLPSWRGTRSAVLAAVLSFLAYNFFFIDPVQTMTIARPHELFALLIFLAVATLTGSLTGRIRAQARAAMVQTRVIEAQAAFSRKLAAASTEDDVLWATVTQVHAMLGGKTILMARRRARAGRPCGLASRRTCRPRRIDRRALGAGKGRGSGLAHRDIAQHPAAVPTADHRSPCGGSSGV